MVRDIHFGQQRKWPGNWAATTSTTHEDQDMNKRILAVTVLMSMFAGAPQGALAGDGFYVGASIGSAQLNDDFDGLDVDDDTVAYRIVGGWRVNRYFGLEAGYQNFGDFEQNVTINGVTSKAKLSADGYTFGVTGSYPVSDRVEVFGRGGWFFWDGNADVNNVSQASPEDTNLYYGAGLSFGLSKRFHINTDWTRFELKSTESDVFSVGLQYRFGK